MKTFTKDELQAIHPKLGEIIVLPPDAQGGSMRYDVELGTYTLCIQEKYYDSHIALGVDCINRHAVAVEATAALKGWDS